MTKLAPMSVTGLIMGVWFFALWSVITWAENGSPIRVHASTDVVQRRWRVRNRSGIMLAVFVKPMVRLMEEFDEYRSYSGRLKSRRS